MKKQIQLIALLTVVLEELYTLHCHATGEVPSKQGQCDYADRVIKDARIIVENEADYFISGNMLRGMFGFLLGLAFVPVLIGVSGMLMEFFI